MKLTAKEVLIHLKEILEYNLEELATADETQFVLGERLAYVECLEIIQRWNGARKIGLNYPIESRFPVE